MLTCPRVSDAIYDLSLTCKLKQQVGDKKPKKSISLWRFKAYQISNKRCGFKHASAWQLTRAANCPIVQHAAARAWVKKIGRGRRVGATAVLREEGEEGEEHQGRVYCPGHAGVKGNDRTD